MRAFADRVIAISREFRFGSSTDTEDFSVSNIEPPKRIFISYNISYSLYNYNAITYTVYPPLQTYKDLYIVSFFATAVNRRERSTNLWFIISYRNACN